MGFFQDISNIFRRSRARREGSASASSPRTGGVASYVVSPPALSVATVYACVNVIANSVAALPVRYMRRRGDIFTDITGDRLHYLLNVQPCPYMSAFDFWKTAVQHVLLTGNAYIVPVMDPFTMEWERLALVSPASVAHDTWNDTYAVNDAYAGVFGVFGEDAIIHLKNYTHDGKTGVSTIAFARTALNIVGTGDAETLNRFANGGNIRGIVSNDTSVRGFGEYQDKELEKTATDIDGKFSSGHKIVSLPGQVQFNQVSLSSTDMQFLETRKFSVREICRFFGVNPSFVFDDTSANYKSSENANAAFLTQTLNPILRKIEQELLRKLVAPSLAGKRRFEFSRNALFAGDPESKVEYQKKTIEAGICTVNEWRVMENRPPVRGGDSLLVSANLKNIETLADGSAPAADNNDIDDEDE